MNLEDRTNNQRTGREALNNTWDPGTILSWTGMGVGIGLYLAGTIYLGAILQVREIQKERQDPSYSVAEYFNEQADGWYEAFRFYPGN